MKISLHALVIVTSVMLLPMPSLLAQDSPQGRASPLVKVEGNVLEELDRKADELTETARRTIEEFINLVGPMLTRLSRLIDGLPVYETPEILPNGDIIIRRKREPLNPGNQGEDGLTET